MDEIAVYMNAVAAMEAICLQYQGRDRIDGIWSLPQYDVAIRMSAEERPPDRIAAWGLQRTVGVAVGVQFWPVTGRFLWHGLDQGLVVLGHREAARGGVGVGAEDVSLTVDDRDLVNDTSTATMGTQLQATHQLAIVPTYRGVRMTATLVFATALAVMVAGAEQGPESACTGFHDPGVQLVPERDARGRPLITWSQVIKAMRLLTRWMVAQDRYEEIDLRILRDGRLIAKGRLKLSGPSGVTAAK